MRVGAAWILPLFVVAPACGELPQFYCRSDSECATDQAQGRCELTNYCSFPDSRCESGWRYGNSASDRYNGACVIEDGQATTSEPIADGDTTGPSAMDEGGVTSGSGSDDDAEGTEDGDSGTTGPADPTGDSTGDGNTEPIPATPEEFGCIEAPLLFDDFEGDDAVGDRWSLDISPMCSIDQANGRMVLSVTAATTPDDGLAIADHPGQLNLSGLTVFGTFSGIPADNAQAELWFDVWSPAFDACESAVTLLHNRLYAWRSIVDEDFLVLDDPSLPTSVRMHLGENEIRYEVWQDGEWFEFHRGDTPCGFQNVTFSVVLAADFLLPATRSVEHVGICRTEEPTASITARKPSN